MKKAILFVFIILINTFLFSQNLKPIPQKVKDYLATGKRVATYVVMVGRKFRPFFMF